MPNELENRPLHPEEQPEEEDVLRENLTAELDNPATVCDLLSYCRELMELETAASAVLTPKEREALCDLLLSYHEKIVEQETANAANRMRATA